MAVVRPRDRSCRECQGSGTMVTMSEQPKRRWYQFSLRTLLIGVTLLAVPCAYVGWQIRIVRARRALRASDFAFFYRAIDMAFFEAEKYPEPATIPWIWERLGDEAIQVV